MKTKHYSFISGVSIIHLRRYSRLSTLKIFDHDLHVGKSVLYGGLCLEFQKIKSDIYNFIEEAYE